jgi:hypothetical protein
MNDFMIQTGIGLLKLLGLVFAIVMPLLILLEIIRHYGILQKAVKHVSPFTKRIGFQDDSVFPLMAGILFGLSYGAGVLLGEARKGRIAGDQAFLIAVFLGLFHAAIEDILLFTSQGAIWWIMVSVRLITAIAVTSLTAAWLRKKVHE